MTALSFIQNSGPFSIRYCNKSLSSNGKDMLGGSFKKSKSMIQSKDTPKRFSTSFPLRASSSPGQSVSNKPMSPRTDMAAQSHTPSSFTTMLRELGIYYVGGGDSR